MKIALACSMKYRALVRETMSTLTELGLTPLFPNLDFSNEDTDKAHTAEEKKRLAMDQYNALDEADIVYFITPKGYLGTSCKLELGYAISTHKPIYFSEPTNDPALDCYVLDFIPTNELERFVVL